MCQRRNPLMQLFQQHIRVKNAQRGIPSAFAGVPASPSSIKAPTLQAPEHVSFLIVFPCKPSEFFTSCIFRNFAFR